MSETRDAAIDTDAIRARAEAAHDEVARLCMGGRWLMSVPAREGYDSDLLISAALDDSDALLRELAALREDVTRLWIYHDWCNAHECEAGAKVETPARAIE